MCGFVLGTGRATPPLGAGPCKRSSRRLPNCCGWRLQLAFSPTSKQHKFAVPKHSRSKHKDYFFHASFCDGKFCFFPTRFDVRKFSLSVLLFPSSPSTRRLSAFYSSAASDFHCCGPQPVAAAKARCMCWVIMSQPALGLAAGTSSKGPMAAADHRPTKAASVIARCKGRAVHARDRANHRTKLAASALQLPPTSMPSTTKRHRDARPISNDAPVIPPCSLEVEVADKHVRNHTCSGLVADTRSGPFKRPTSVGAESPLLSDVRPR